jgi:hypothetical protein
MKCFRYDEQRSSLHAEGLMVVKCGVDIAVCYFDILYIVQCAVVTGGYVWCGYSGLLF